MWLEYCRNLAIREYVAQGCHRSPQLLWVVGVVVDIYLLRGVEVDLHTALDTLETVEASTHSILIKLLALDTCCCPEHRHRSNGVLDMYLAQDAETAALDASIGKNYVVAVVSALDKFYVLCVEVATLVARVSIYLTRCVIEIYHYPLLND